MAGDMQPVTTGYRGMWSKLWASANTANVSRNHMIARSPTRMKQAVAKLGTRPPATQCPAAGCMASTYKHLQCYP